MAQTSFNLKKIPNEIYKMSGEAVDILAVRNIYVKSVSVWKGLQAMVDTSIMIVDLLAFCNLDLFGAEHYGGVTNCVQKIMQKSNVWHICWNLVYITH